MDEKLTDAIEKGNEALAWYTSDNYPETSTCYINSGTLKTLIRAASTPSAEVEYWKDKCYTAESDAEIHAQCHDKVFDEKKALEAEVQALRDAIDDIWPILQGGMTLSGLPHTAVGKIMDKLDAVFRRWNNGKEC